MDIINSNSTRIFCQLIALMEGKKRHEISNDPYLPLSIAHLGTGIQTPSGVASAYSLCHFHSQEGKFIEDPEMCFFMADARKRPDDYSSVYLFPSRFRNTNVGVFEESISFMAAGIGVYLPKLHRKHVMFAQNWLVKLEAQGFLGREK